MDCVSEMGSSLKPLSKEDLAKLREAVEAEVAGLVSMEVLKGVLEEMYDRLGGGEAFDDVVEGTAIQIQRLYGIGHGREMLKFTEALGNLALEQEEEIRKRIRKLANLGERK